MVLDRSIIGAFARLAHDPDMQAMTPHHPAATRTAGEASDAIGDEIAGFMARALAAPEGATPEHAALIVGVGLGKTRHAGMALAGLGGFIAAAKAAGKPHRVLYLTPRHDLHEEIVIRLRELGLTAAIWRGRDADDPHAAAPAPGTKPAAMCINPLAASDAVKAGYRVSEAACGTGLPDEPSCALFHECSFNRQHALVAAADVALAANQLAFRQLPAPVGKGIGLVIFDEGFWQTGLTPNRALRLADHVEQVERFPPLRKDMISGLPVRDDMATNDMLTLSRRLQVAFENTPEDAFLTRDSVVAAGLTAENCHQAVRMEWNRKVEGQMRPGMSRKARQEALDRAAGNAAIPLRVAIWQAVAAFLDGEDAKCGRLLAAMHTNDDGEHYRAIRLHTRHDIGDAVLKLPILAMDATMPASIVRHFLPRLDVLADIQAALFFVTLFQLVSGSGKSSLVPSDKATPEENRRRLRRAAAFADFLALHGRGNALASPIRQLRRSFVAPACARRTSTPLLGSISSRMSIRSDHSGDRCQMTGRCVTSPLP